MLTPTLSSLSALEYDWSLWARPSQLPPQGDWRTWLVLAGRGFGKTRTGAEWIRAQVDAGRDRIALVGPTAADCRDVMVEGESGLLKVFPKDQRPTYRPSLRRVEFHTGAHATTYSAAEPDRLRGPQHEIAWADEVGAWTAPEALDMLSLGLRLGPMPRLVVTTTPKPSDTIRQLIAQQDIAITTGSTFDNSLNLPPSFIDQIKQRYEGTRLGRQELYAEVLTDVPGALWTREMIDPFRLPPNMSELQRVVIAVDPAISSRDTSDETGIIVAGIDRQQHGYVLADLSVKASPDTWARRIVAAYQQYGADRIVAEVNQGGDMVETVLRTVDPNIPYRSVRASRSKSVRAEPVAALYEQKRIHHCGVFDRLEDQMLTFVPDMPTAKSPDRVDAMVYAFTDLILSQTEWFVV